MALRSFALRDFRNHKNIQLSLDKGVSVITGPNAIGKTSLLEAIALLGSGRSFRMAKTKDFVRFGCEHSVLRAQVSHVGLESDIRIEITQSSKKISVNDKNIKKLRALGELLPFVVFAPSDHQIVEGDAGDRRHFLNQALSSYDFDYADILSDYTRTLTQRNKLLKELSERSGGWSVFLEQSEVWDIRLSQLGAELFLRRKKYLHRLSECAAHEYKRISKREDALEVTYNAFGVEQKFSFFREQDLYANQIEEELRNQWKDSVRLDFATRTTNVGPHKDDIYLTLNGKETKFYCSQGEKRTTVLALRLGEVELLRKKVSLAPVLLVDDVSSELDSSRREALVELLRQEELQVLITSTELPATLINATERPYEHWNLADWGVSKV